MCGNDKTHLSGHKNHNRKKDAWKEISFRMGIHVENVPNKTNPP
jgi:hypothetical protein